MKNPFHYIQEYPKRSKGLLGISHEQFLQLVRQAEIHERQQQAQRECTKIRLNAKGGGRPPKLTRPEQVCLCLFYLRHLPTFEVLGIQFGVSKTAANDTFHYWLAVLRKLLPTSLLEQLENEASLLGNGIGTSERVSVDSRQHRASSLRDLETRKSSRNTSRGKRNSTLLKTSSSPYQNVRTL